MSLTCVHPGCDWISAEHALCPRHQRPVLTGRDLGWAMAMTRWRDETGAMHVVTSTASGSSVWLACGARPFTYGGIESRQSVAPRGRACRTCLRYAKRRAVAFDTTK